MNDLISLFRPSDDTPAVQVRQGVVDSWDAATGDNTIRVAGGVLLNVPALKAGSATLAAGDVVNLLSVGNQWFLLGNVTTPGDPGTVPTWNVDITALTGQVDTIQTVTIPAVQGDVTIVQGQVIDLGTDVVTAQSTADTAQSTATGAASAASTAQGTANSAASAASAAASAAATAQAGVDGLQTDLDAAEADVAAVTADVATLTGTTIPGLQSDIDANAADITTLTGTTLPGLSSDLSAAQSDITGLQSDLGTAQTDITAAQAAADAAQATADGILPIGTTDISNSAITTPKIAANAITATEIATDAVVAGKIQAGAITTAKLAAGAVTTTELGAGAVTAIKIAADTITAAQIAASAITASELAANAVTAGKIAAGTIVAADIAADTITATQIAASAITSSELAAGAVVAGKIAAGTIVAADIAASTITAAKIAAGTITATEISAGAITAAKLDAAAITGKTITGGLFRTAASGQRIEIDSATATNLMNFYSGAASETAPGFIKSDVVSGGAYTKIGSPELSGGPGGVASLNLQKIASTGITTASLDAVNVDLNATQLVNLSGQEVDISAIDIVATGTFTVNGDDVMVVGGNPQPVLSFSATDITSISSTSFIPGTPVVGIAFTAPDTGKVYIVVSGHMASAGIANAYIYLAAEVRTGSTVGSGTVFHAAVTDEGVSIGQADTNITRISGSNEILVTGLTPGSSYNVRLVYLTTAGTNATIFYRAVLVKPVL